MCCNRSEPSYPPFAMFACHLLKGMKKAPFSECLGVFILKLAYNLRLTCVKLSVNGEKLGKSWVICGHKKTA